MDDLSLTLTGLTICIIVGVFSFLRHFRKRETLKAAPVVPWIIPALAALAMGFMLMVHLVNLMGIETGGKFR